MSDQLQNYLLQNTKDAVIYYAAQFLEKAETPHEKQEGMERVAELLCLIEKDILRESYLDQIAKAHKWVRKTDLKKLIGKAQEVQNHNTQIEVVEQAFKLDLPESDRNDVMRFGFYSKIDGENTGYYFRNGEEGHFKAISNFVITPLFHKYDHEDNTRIIKIDNGLDPSVTVEMPSSALLSTDKFRSFVFDEGGFFFNGTKQNLDRLLKRYLFEFPKAYELKTLGWQKEGFFAFFNKSFNGKLADYNEAGLVKHGDQYFFSPASSDIYKNYRKDDDGDLYENDRFLEHVEAPIGFEEWCELMTSVYGDHAKAGISWALKTLFKDIVFKVDNNDPFLYCYGQSKSGKSKFAESVCAIFFKNMPAFNLNSGTDFSFAARFSRFRNCPVFFNEFDDSVVKDEWFQAIKGAFDGEGRERGKGLSKRKTETQKVNGSLLLVGQYLSTKDDNSVLSRSIPLAFQLVRSRRTEQLEKYNRLKKMEKDGLTSIICELLPYRDKVSDEYYGVFSEVLKELTSLIKEAQEEHDERVIRNYSCLVAMIKIFSQDFKFPFTYKGFRAWAAQEVIDLSKQLTQNDILVDFWHTVEAMLENGKLIHGTHLKVEHLQSVVTYEKGKEPVTLAFDKPKRILFVRMSIVQKEYAQFKRSTGSPGMDLTSLTTYTKQREYYMGYCDKTEFKKSIGGREVRTISSAYLFDMDSLGFDFERTEVVPDFSGSTYDEKRGAASDSSKDKLPF